MSNPTKRILLIAYHYPPVKGSSGMQRTLKFAEYLPAFNWEPLVLSVHPRAYARTNPEQLAEIPAGQVVRRAFALDTGQHLAIRDYYPRLLAIPDRWASWWLGALPVALSMIRRYRPDVIWSTYPVATAHLIGLSLRRLTGLPWVADFRDPMVDEVTTIDAIERRVFAWLEARSVRHCERAVFVTPGAEALYRRRYPGLEARTRVIANGFDERHFTRPPVTPAAAGDKPLTLLHSGIMYRDARDPEAFFRALVALKARGEISAENLRIVLRDARYEKHHGARIAHYGIGDLVHLAPVVGYREAINEMFEADGLLLFQAASCNRQIPAKAYEYLRTGRPILALTDPLGDTAGLLRDNGVDSIVALDRSDAIVEALRAFLARLRVGSAHLADPTRAASYSRRGRTRELAALLDELTEARSASD